MSTICNCVTSPPLLHVTPCHEFVQACPDIQFAFVCQVVSPPVESYSARNAVNSSLQEKELPYAAPELPANICFVVAREVSQQRSWSKDEAPENEKLKFATLDTFHGETSWSKAVASRKMEDMSETLRVFQRLMSWLKVVAPENASFRFMTFDTAHS